MRLCQRARESGTCPGHNHAKEPMAWVAQADGCRTGKSYDGNWVKSDVKGSPSSVLARQPLFESDRSHSQSLRSSLTRCRSPQHAAFWQLREVRECRPSHRERRHSRRRGVGREAAHHRRLETCSRIHRRVRLIAPRQFPCRLLPPLPRPAERSRYPIANWRRIPSLRLTPSLVRHRHMSIQTERGCTGLEGTLAA